MVGVVVKKGVIEQSSILKFKVRVVVHDTVADHIGELCFIGIERNFTLDCFGGTFQRQQTYGR